MTGKTNIAIALRKHRLLEAKQITGLVEDRIRPLVLLEGDDYPAIVYGIENHDPQHHLDGSDGFAFTRIMYKCYGETLDDAEHLAAQLEDVLDGFSGTLGSAPAVGDDDERVYVSDCTLENGYHREIFRGAGEGRPRFFCARPFMVSHSKPLPSLTLE
jgi:hypothetical protein